MKQKYPPFKSLFSEIQDCCEVKVRFLIKKKIVFLFRCLLLLFCVPESLFLLCFEMMS